jgi:hypothetical protein
VLGLPGTGGRARRGAKVAIRAVVPLSVTFKLGRGQFWHRPLAPAGQLEGRGAAGRSFSRSESGIRRRRGAPAPVSNLPVIALPLGGPGGSRGFGAVWCVRVTVSRCAARSHQCHVRPHPRVCKLQCNRVTFGFTSVSCGDCVFFDSAKTEARGEFPYNPTWAPNPNLKQHPLAGCRNTHLLQDP